MPDDISRHKYALRQKQTELRAILAEWDPIGVYGTSHPAPPDEYDCLLGVIGQLRGGMSQDQLESFLDQQMSHHFGLGHPAAGTREFAEKIHRWYWRDPLPGSAPAGG